MSAGLCVWVVGDRHGPSDGLLGRFLERLHGADAEVSVGVGVESGELAAWCVERGVAGPDVVVVWMGHRWGPALRRLWDESEHVRRLRWLHCLSAGLDHFLPHDGLSGGEHVITNAKGVFASSLGEWVLGACLHFAKSLRRLYDAQRAGLWQPFAVRELRGATMTIIGYGGIGREVARRAVAFDMCVVAVSRSHGEATGVDALGVVLRPLSGLDAALADSDYVVLATPLTPDTRQMIGRRQIACMKRTAVLINVGRGACVDEPALVEALEQGAIAGAALDVFAEEPLPLDSPLWRLDNVLLSPHSADQTDTWIDNSIDVFFDNLARHRQGAALINRVDKQLGY